MTILYSGCPWSRHLLPVLVLRIQRIYRNHGYLWCSNDKRQSRTEQTPWFTPHNRDFGCQRSEKATQSLMEIKVLLSSHNKNDMSAVRQIEKGGRQPCSCLTWYPNGAKPSRRLPTFFASDYTQRRRCVSVPAVKDEISVMPPPISCGFRPLQWWVGVLWTSNDRGRLLLINTERTAPLARIRKSRSGLIIKIRLWSWSYLS